MKIELPNTHVMKITFGITIPMSYFYTKTQLTTVAPMFFTFSNTLLLLFSFAEYTIFQWNLHYTIDNKQKPVVTHETTGQSQVVCASLCK